MDISLQPVTMKLPSSWTIGSLIALGASEQDAQGGDDDARSFQENVVLTTDTLQGDETLDQCLERQYTALKQQRALKPGQVKKSPTTVSGKPGIIAEHVLIVPGEKTEIRQIQLYVAAGKKVYIVTLSQLNGDLFEKSRRAFEGIVASVKIA